MNLFERRILLILISGILILLVASPVLTRLLVFPRTEFFTEFWILDSNHGTKDYPFNVTLTHDYNVFLGIANHLGYCAYYSVEVKFRNQTQSAPDRFNHASSSLPALFNISAFVADEGALEQPLTLSFAYQYNESLSRVEFSSLKLNGNELDLNTMITRDKENGFPGFLFFELWIYNGTSNSFQYHNRFLSLKLDMTV